MIFVSGVHGSGKTYFCGRVEEALGCSTYSASKLITQRKQSGFAPDKLIPDIEDNQAYLLSAVEELNEKSSSYLLDGHFCLLNADGIVTRIVSYTFVALSPSAFLLITAEPELITERRQERDGIEHNAEDIRHFQDEELAYATELSERLNIIVNDYYHDPLFPYSELKHTIQESVGISAANGMSKVYIGAQVAPHYAPGEPVFIYRKHSKNDGQKPRYKSCLTSVCVVTNIIKVKSNSNPLVSFDDLLSRIGNKSVFDENDMRAKYNNDRNMVVIELLYCNYFGEGNNVNMDWLDRNGCWVGQGQ